jgi:hypothetical protein
MLKRFPITLLLGFALLFSQGGVLLVAALCPHLNFSVPICDAPKMNRGMDHSQMGHHDMGHDSWGPAAASNSHDVNTAIGEAEQSCSHCVIHSPSNSNLKVVRIADTVKRSLDGDISHSVVILPRIAPVAVAVLTPRDNGPPGKASRPKHLLINTFRI